MSTKSTIAHGDDWHIYEELMEKRPNNVYLEQYSSSDKSSTLVNLPWEGLIKLAEYVTDVAQEEAELSDPEWLTGEISRLESNLSFYQGREWVGSITPLEAIVKISLESRLPEMQDRLHALENPSTGGTVEFYVDDNKALCKLTKYVKKHSNVQLLSLMLSVDIYVAKLHFSDDLEEAAILLENTIYGVNIRDTDCG